MISAVKGLQLSLPTCSVGMYFSCVEFCCWECGVQVKQAFSVGKASPTILPLFQTCIPSIQKNFTLAFSHNFYSIINLSLCKVWWITWLLSLELGAKTSCFSRSDCSLNTFIINTSSILSQLFLYFLYEIYSVRTWGSVNFIISWILFWAAWITSFTAVFDSASSCTADAKLLFDSL